MNPRKLTLWLLAAAAAALLLAPCLPAATSTEVNFNALRTATAVNQNDDLLVNWKSNTVYYARRVAYSYLHAALTNASATIASNVISAFSNNNAVYVRPDGYAVGTRGRPDKPWNSVSNALTAALNGDTVFIMPGSYTNAHTNLWLRRVDFAGISDPIWTKTNLTILGLGYPTLWYATTNSGMIIHQSSNVFVSGIKFRAIGTFTTNIAASLGNSALMGISQSEYVTVKDCRFEGPQFFGIGDAGTNWPSTNNIRITDCSFLGFGIFIPDWGGGNWDGAGCWSSGWSVESCSFLRCSRGVEIYPRLQGDVWTGRTRASVRNCQFSDVLYQAITDGGSGSFIQCDIQNNTIFSDTNNAFLGGSNLTSRPGAAICITGGEGINCSGNSIRNYATGISVGQSYGASNSIISANNIAGLWHYAGQGIAMGDVGRTVRDCVVTGNVLEDGHCDAGILMSAGLECRVFGNVVGATKLTSSTGKGIRFYDCVNVFVDGNTIIDSQAVPTTQYGISVENNSTNVVAGYNDIRGYSSSAMTGSLNPIGSRWGMPPNRTVLSDLFGIERFISPEGMFSDENFSGIASMSAVQTNIAQNGTCTQQPYPATWTNAYERLGYRRLGATNGAGSYASLWRGYQGTMASQRLGTNWWFETLLYPEQYGASTPTNLNFWAGFSSSAVLNAPTWFVGFHLTPTAASTTNLVAVVRTNGIHAYSNMFTFPVRTNVYLRLGVQGNTNNTFTFFTNGVSCGTQTIAITNLGYQLVAPAVYCGMVQTNLIVASSNAVSVRYLRAYTGE